MNFQETEALFQAIKEELGQPQVALMTDKEFSAINGDRKGDDPYAITFATEPPSITVTWRSKSEKIVKRSMYQAIAEALWPKLPRDKFVWYGLVMSQPHDLPKRVEVPTGAKTRSALLKLSVAQAKRKS